jgi:hypothetical protein
LIRNKYFRIRSRNIWTRILNKFGEKMRKKQKSWIQQLSESYIRQNLRENAISSSFPPELPPQQPQPQPQPEPFNPNPFPSEIPPTRPTGQVDPFANYMSGKHPLDGFTNKPPGTYKLNPPATETVIVHENGTVTVIFEGPPPFALTYQYLNGQWRLITPSKPKK